MDDKNWPYFKKKIVSVGFMSAKRVTATNWKIINNVNEKSWLQTFETLLSLEQMSNSIYTCSYKTWNQINVQIYNNITCPD